MGALCADCQNNVTSSLVVNGHLVRLCSDCKRLHNELRLNTELQGSAAKEASDGEAKEEIRDPWETKIQPFYTNVQRLAYIDEKYLQRSFPIEGVTHMTDCWEGPVLHLWPVDERNSLLGIKGSLLSISVVTFHEGPDTARSHVALRRDAVELQTFKGLQVRSASLVPRNADFGVLVRLTFYQDKVVKTFFGVMKNFSCAFRLLNKVQKQIYLRVPSADAVPRLRKLDAHMFVVLKGRFLNSCYLCVVDKECIWLCRAYESTKEPKVLSTIYFRSDLARQRGNTIQTIHVHSSGTSVEIITQTETYILGKRGLDSGEFEEFCRLIQKFHEQKHASSTTEDPNATFTRDRAQPNESRDEGYFGKTLYETIRMSSRDAMPFDEEKAHDDSFYGGPGYASEAGASYRSYRQEECFGFPENVKRLLDQAVDSASETLLVLWAVAEAEIEQFERDGRIPESTIASGGLDPNRVDHFKQCEEEVKEAIFNQQYDLAASHASGMQQVYRTSFNAALSWFVKEHELIPMMKLIFLAGVTDILRQEN